MKLFSCTLILCAALASSVYAATLSPEQLLTKYAWTASTYTEHAVTLPKQFVHEPGTYPMALYWAFNNELSRKIKLDMKKYREKNVLVRIYPVKEPMPDACAPFNTGNAFIVLFNNKVIGAWVASVTCACSLDRKYLNTMTIAEMPWDKWLIKRKIVLVKNQIDAALFGATPNDIVSKLFKAISSKNTEESQVYFTRRYLLNMLLFNLSATNTYSTSFTHSFVGDISSLESITLVDMNVLPSNEDNITAYEVDSILVYANTVPVERKWIFIFKKEIPALGWRIADIRRGRNITD